MGSARRTFLLVATLALAPGADGATLQEVKRSSADDEVLLRGFQIYDTQAARGLAASAEEHVRAGRWSEALVELQQLIEDHRGEMLGATRPLVKERGLRSEQDVHYGASDHATRRLFELDDEATDLYRRRFSERAAKALLAAIANSDRAALMTVARRWPLTREAKRAWWALGDLEFEFGNLEVGVRAWNRALARALGEYSLVFETPDDWRAALDTLALSSDVTEQEVRGIRQRIELALSLLGARDDRGVDVDATGPGGSALEPGLAFAASPGASPDSWRDPFELPSAHPFRSGYSRFTLFPARWQDIVFASTTMELIAVGAYTGELLWQSDQPRGWKGMSPQERQPYFETVDDKDSLIAPVAAHGVVVAALQAPIKAEEKIDYGDMKIIRLIPNRRLFAFDAATGRPLWNTLPPPMWNGESGSFADRMRIVGSPTIVGSRVLVPAARLRGRIEYHVGCFDLYTGDLLWSTALITGQRELNMFGRTVMEFSAPPVRVVGNSVITLTQLGTVAALDLFTGDTLWEVLYEQILMPPNNSFRIRPRRWTWRNAPPFVTGNTVIATPNDSEQLIAVNLDTGALVWSMSHEMVNRIGDPSDPSSRGINLLVGADDRHVYFGGRKLVALRASRDISKEAPTRPAWVFPAGSNDTVGPDTPRPVLTEDRIYVPDLNSLSILDVRTGKLAADPTTWGKPGPGNLLIGDGMMFALNGRRLGGYFDWDKLVQRAREQFAESPGDIDRAVTLAVLLENRGVAEWSTEGSAASTRLAREHLVEAREVLRSVMGPSGEETHPTVLAEMHGVLRAEARVLKNLADSKAALRLLGEARTLAPSREDLRDTLLEEQAILYGRDRDGWLEAIEALLAECSDLSLHCEAILSREGGQRWRGRLIPLVGTRETPGATNLKLPVGLWALIERSETFGVAGRSGEEFRDLHAILERYGNEPMADFRARDWAADRIGTKLREGDDGGYELYEARAQEMYERAMQEQDVSLLRLIPEYFPHSGAARTSNDARLRLAMEEGDVRVVTSIVLGELRDDWRPETATEGETRRLLRLAYALGEEGNTAFRAGLAGALARTRPDLVVDLPGVEGVRLSDLSERWRAPAQPEPAASVATFDHGVRAVPSPPTGRYERLGELQRAEGQTGHVLLFAEDRKLRAFTDGEEGDWLATVGMRESPDHWSGRFATTPGLAHLATESRVVTFERDTGDEAWAWEGRSDGILALASSDGVVVVVENLHPSDKREHLAVGLDAVSGVELWRLAIDARSFHTRPICGDRKVAFLPLKSPARGEIHERFTGRLTATFEAPSLRDNSAGAAWIEEDRLIIPRFSQSREPERNHVFAIDVETGGEAWKVDFQRILLGESELTSVITQGSRTYLVLMPSRQLGEERRGAIYTLDPRIGSIGSGPLVELRTTDRLMGIKKWARTDLEAPFLFLWRNPRQGENSTLRAIRLPYGRTWEAHLPVSEDDLYNPTMPLPALSDSTVAIAWKEFRRGTRSTRTELVFLDRSTGSMRDHRTLPDEIDGGTAVQLSALGTGLIICGAKRMEIMK